MWIYLWIALAMACVGLWVASLAMAKVIRERRHQGLEDWCGENYGAQRW